MNTKKQTVWLMTMLGLMVVLSAYYLFTEDVQNVPLAFTPPTNTDTIVTPEQATATPPQTPATAPSDLAETTKDTASPAPETQKTAVDATTSAPLNTETHTPQDDTAVLEQVMTDPQGEDALTVMQMTRSSQISQQLEQLTAQMTDAQASDADIAKASAQHDALMDRESKVIAFEESVLQEYENVVVTHEDKQDQYTIHVNAPSFSQTQAANLITAALEQLQISPNQVAVKWVK